jgi:hypothetical protein
MVLLKISFLECYAVSAGTQTLTYRTNDRNPLAFGYCTLTSTPSRRLLFTNRHGGNYLSKFVAQANGRGAPDKTTKQRTVCYFSSRGTNLPTAALNHVITVNQRAIMLD